MQCPFCQLDMNCIDNGTPKVPATMMIWVCKSCPNEVRVVAEKDAETEQHWITKHTSIFILHHEKEYCLHWDHINKHFDIRDCSASTGGGIVFRTSVMPNSVTPTNAYDKFLTYLVFS